MKKTIIDFLETLDLTKTFISFDKALIKKECLILNNYQNKIDKDGILILLKDNKEINSFLKIQNKNVILSDANDNIQALIPIIHSIYFINDTYLIQFSPEINMNKILKDFIFFKEKLSHVLYQYLIREKSNEIYISIDKLKDILETVNEYERFFDFEKHILKPLIQDLKNSFPQLQIEKIKKKEFNNSKVISVKFNLN